MTSLLVLFLVFVATGGLVPTEESTQQLNKEIRCETAQDSNGIKFLLYTRKNPEKPDKLIVDDKESVLNSNYINNATVKFIIHGFLGAYFGPFPFDLQAEYLNKSTDDLNIIVVDWSVLSAGPVTIPHYQNAKRNTKVVGVEGGKLLEFLIQLGVTSLDKIHIIGHSLGAHVSGIIGHYIFNKMGSKISRITGLDPARPSYDSVANKNRLDKSDATFVDVIHTSGLLGMIKPLGTVDFYPNGGLRQPGCTQPSEFNKGCSHARSHEYFKESVSNPKGFKAFKCPDLLQGNFTQDNCLCMENDITSFAYMGEFVSNSSEGIFYLNTRDSAPYAKEGKGEY